jgi:hypothetical protein
MKTAPHDAATLKIEADKEKAFFEDHIAAIFCGLYGVTVLIVTTLMGAFQLFVHFNR